MTHLGSGQTRRSAPTEIITKRLARDSLLKHHWV